MLRYAKEDIQTSKIGESKIVYMDVHDGDGAFFNHIQNVEDSM